jgi:glycosyltransferase involved in cell wall biosynthesis
MNKKNLISILITNYNKGFFLQRSLKSVCNQNFKNYEIILFDDSSTDNSIEIIKKYKKVKLIKNQSTRRKTGPLNQIKGLIECFKQSKGNLICLLDADDVFKKNKLKEINQFFTKNKKLNCIFDMPFNTLSEFNFKNKSIKHSIWSTIFPTSCISLRRKFFKTFLKNIYKNNFPNLEIDARLSIFSKFYMNEYTIHSKKLTYYNYDHNGITANIKKYSKRWWIRRSEAFSYLRIIIKKKNIFFKASFDYYFTSALTFFMR